MVKQPTNSSIKDAQQRLWHYLSSDNLSGHKFAMHHSIGPYVCDFVCLEQKLIIEMIGEQQIIRKTANYTRTKYLEILRFRVLWISESEVLRDFDIVKKKIESEIMRPSLGEGKIKEQDTPPPYFVTPIPERQTPNANELICSLFEDQNDKAISYGQ